MQSHAQVPIDKCPSVVNSSDSILIADETTLNYTKTGARIHCSNESVFNILYRSHSAMFKRYSCAFKRDRHGWYKDYLIYLSKEDASYIINWAKTNL
jgi:hypothetical protein